MSARPGQGGNAAPDSATRRNRIVAIGLLAGCAALVAFSAAASAHHANPTCTAGGYTQTWTGPYWLPNLTVITDECILVHGDINVNASAFAHFRDTALYFANNISGNSTVHIGTNATWKMSDFDGDPLTGADRSALSVLNQSNLSRGFFFDAAPNSNVYINDTIITGGGLPGNGLGPLSGMYFSSLNDFAWNHVFHVTWANGLLLLNFSRGGVSTDYNVTVGMGPPTPGAIGLYLSEVGNRTFEVLATRLMTNGVLVNDSTNISFKGFNSSASATALVANRVTGLLIQDMLDRDARSASIDLNLVVNATVRRAKITPNQGLQSTFGIQLDGARNVAIYDSELANQVVNLHTQFGTRDLLVQNVSLRGAPNVNTKGVWAQEAADIFTLSNFTFRAVTISSRGEGMNLTGVGGARIENSTVSTGVYFGLGCVRCFDVTFSDGLIDGWGSGVWASGDNLTVQRSLLQNNGAGLLVGDGSFRIESVTFQVNTFSITSTAAARLGPSSIANSSIPSGNPGDGADAVRITGFDTSSFSRLFVFQNNFTNTYPVPSGLAGLRLSKIGRIDVVNNTFLGLPVNVSQSGTLVSTGNTYRISTLPLGVAIIFFDNSSSLTVSRENFVAPTPPLGIGTVVRAPSLSAQALVTDLKMPASDYGVWITADAASSLVTSATLYNLTTFARRDALTVLGINQVAVDNVTVDGGVNAVVIFGGGTAQDLALRNAFLTASGTAANLSADSAGRVTVNDIAVNRSGATPTRVLSLQGGSLVTVARISLDGLPVGIVASDTRRLVLTDQNFTDNNVGLRMDAPSATSVVLNWTIRSAARIQNTSLRFTGDIIVQGVALTVRNANFSVFALTSDPRNSHFFFEGASVVSFSGGGSVATEPGSGGRTQDSRFTMELSPAAIFELNPSPTDRTAVFEGLGDLQSGLWSQQGIFFQARGASIYNVHFLNGSRPLLAAGVDLIVVNCTFIGGSGALAAVTVTGGGSARVSRSSVANHDGIEATGADAFIDNTSFNGAGIVLLITNGQGGIEDSSVQFASKVVEAKNASVVRVHRVASHDIFQAVYDADSNSDIIVYSSYLDGDLGVFDAIARNGATITFEDTFVDRFLNGRRTYSTATSPAGTFTAFWNLQFAACVLSDRSRPAGAGINVTGAQGGFVFSGATGSDGLTTLVHFLEYESHGGVETYHVPFSLEVRIGLLSAVEEVLYRNQTVVELCLDDVAPEIRLLEACPTYTSVDTCEITVLVRDEDSALAPGSPCFGFNTGACVAKGSSSPQTSIVVTVTVILQEGNNTWCFIAYDLYGNEGRLCQVPVLDQTGPTIVECQPGLSMKTKNATVALTCEISGAPKWGVFGRIIADSCECDASDGFIHATITLAEGANTFDLSINDTLGNINKVTFSWTLDFDAPDVDLSTDLSQPVTTTRLLIIGRVPSDTQLITFNGVPLTIIGGQFTVFWDVPNEGLNQAVFYAVDDVGNAVNQTVSVVRDTTTNCRLITPEKGSQTGETPLLVAGRCDDDVSVTVNNAAVPVGLDGTWSVRVTLVAGQNTIQLSGKDANGATWYDEARVYYVRSDGVADGGLLLIFGLLAAGTLAAAFLISRRPRVQPNEPEHRPQTGAQKAPPRPKPMTLKLPDTPEDMTFRPKPPSRP